METSVISRRPFSSSVIFARARASVGFAPIRLALGVVGLAVTAQIVIPLPFSPVPLSLGTLGAMLLGVVLGPRLGMAAAAIYGILGAAGVPILAGFQSGIMLASFGYVLGYIAAAGLCGYFAQKMEKVTFGRALLLAIGGGLAVYPFGVAWLALVWGMPLSSTLLLGVVPFLLGDALKALLVGGVVLAVKR